MFDKEYSFKGSHANKVIKLTAQFDSNSSSKLFSRNIDVYIIAPLIGFLYGRRSLVDKSTTDTTKIFPQQLANEQTNIKYNYQLIMLLDKKNEPVVDERINKSFRYYGSKQTANDLKIYDEYVLGGVDVLYEKLIENSTGTDEYIRSLYEFMEDFNERYNEAVTNDSILELCKLAQI